MNTYTGKSGISLGDAHIVMSIADKLIMLLIKPSILTPEERVELYRIRALTRKAWNYKTNSEFIKNTYTKYY